MPDAFLGPKSKRHVQYSEVITLNSVAWSKSWFRETHWKWKFLELYTHVNMCDLKLSGEKLITDENTGRQAQSATCTCTCTCSLYGHNALPLEVINICQQQW